MTIPFKNCFSTDAASRNVLNLFWTMAAYWAGVMRFSASFSFFRANISDCLRTASNLFCSRAHKFPFFTCFFCTFGANIDRFGVAVGVVILLKETDPASSFRAAVFFRTLSRAVAHWCLEVDSASAASPDPTCVGMPLNESHYRLYTCGNSITYFVQGEPQVVPWYLHSPH